MIYEMGVGIFSRTIVFDPIPRDEEMVEAVKMHYRRLMGERE
jgi:hypothetical protein